MRTAARSGGPREERVYDLMQAKKQVIEASRHLDIAVCDFKENQRAALASALQNLERGGAQAHDAAVSTLRELLDDLSCR